MQQAALGGTSDQGVAPRRVTVHGAALAALYSLVLGGVVGAVAITVDRVVTGPRGRRTTRAPQGATIRPEPGRTRALI